MFRLKANDLAKLPKVLRYGYYVVSTFRLVRMRAWESQGEPNPFVARRAPKRAVSRVDVIEILGDFDPLNDINSIHKKAPPNVPELPSDHLMRPSHLRARRYSLAS